MLGLVIAARRSRALPTSVTAFGLVAAAVHAASGIGFARAGALPPTAIGSVAAGAFALWLVVIGVALLLAPAAKDSLVAVAA